MAYLLQTIVTQINHAIGAEGIVSMECKTIVSQYGEMIWDLLVSGVCSFSLLFISHFSPNRSPGPDVMWLKPGF